MANSKYEISVIMCCYNADKYIGSAIQSILSQSFKDFEFIIWNDGSTDGTEAVIKSFHDDRIKYYYDTNHGIGYARNKSYSLAIGKYIACMDADDISFEYRLEMQYKFLEANPSYVAVSSGVLVIDADDVEIGYTIPCSASKIIKKALNHYNCIVNPASMIRKSAFEQCGGFIPIPLGEDWALWRRLSRIGSLYNIRIPCLRYRVLKESLSHSFHNTSYANEICQIERRIVLSEKYNQNEIRKLENLIFMAKRKCTGGVSKIKIDIGIKYRCLYGLISVIKDIYGLLRY